MHAQNDSDYPAAPSLPSSGFNVNAGSHPRAHWIRAARCAAFVRQVAFVSKHLDGSDALHHSVKRQGNYARYLETLRMGVKGMAVARAFEVNRLVHQSTADAQQQIQAGNIVTDVADASELEAVPLWAQGDAHLATKEKMAERQVLRYHPKVLAALQLFWEAAQRSLQSGGDTSANELHRKGHALMLRRIYRVMIRDFDAADCERCIAEDWERDARGKDALSRKLFCDAFFELADNVSVILMPGHALGVGSFAYGA